MATSAQVSKQDFISSIRQKYPAYSEELIDDDNLFRAVVQKYPVYEQQIDPLTFDARELTLPVQTIPQFDEVAFPSSTPMQPQVQQEAVVPQGLHGAPTPFTGTVQPAQEQVLSLEGALAQPDLGEAPVGPSVLQAQTALPPGPQAGNIALSAKKFQGLVNTSFDNPSEFEKFLGEYGGDPSVLIQDLSDSETELMAAKFNQKAGDAKLIDADVFDVTFAGEVAREPEVIFKDIATFMKNEAPHVLDGCTQLKQRRERLDKLREERKQVLRETQGLDPNSEEFKELSRKGRVVQARERHLMWQPLNEDEENQWRKQVIDERTAIRKEESTRTNEEVKGFLAGMGGAIVDYVEGVGADVMTEYRIRQMNKDPELKRLSEGNVPVIRRGGSELSQELANLEIAGQETHEERFREIMESGGAEYGAAFEISTAAWQTALKLLIAKSVTGAFPGGVSGGREVASTLQHSMKFATFTYLTTSGSSEERADAAMIAFAYSATPAASSGASTDKLAILVDFGLNSGISFGTGQYKDAWDQAEAIAAEDGVDDWENLPNEEKARYLAITVPTIAVSDLMFSLSTKARTDRGAAELRQSILSDPEIAKMDRAYNDGDYRGFEESKFADDKNVPPMRIPELIRKAKEAPAPPESVRKGILREQAEITRELKRKARPVVPGEEAKEANDPESLAFLRKQLNISENEVAKISKADRQAMLDDPAKLQEEAVRREAAKRAPAEPKVEVKPEPIEKAVPIEEPVKEPVLEAEPKEKQIPKTFRTLKALRDAHGDIPRNQIVKNKGQYRLKKGALSVEPVKEPAKPIPDKEIEAERDRRVKEIREAEKPTPPKKPVKATQQDLIKEPIDLSLRGEEAEDGARITTEKEASAEAKVQADKDQGKLGFVTSTDPKTALDTTIPIEENSRKAILRETDRLGLRVESPYPGVVQQLKDDIEARERTKIAKAKDKKPPAKDVSAEKLADKSKDEPAPFSDEKRADREKRTPLEAKVALASDTPLSRAEITRRVDRLLAGETIKDVTKPETFRTLKALRDTHGDIERSDIEKVGNKYKLKPGAKQQITSKGTSSNEVLSRLDDEGMRSELERLLPELEMARRRSQTEQTGRDVTISEEGLIKPTITSFYPKGFGADDIPAIKDALSGKRLTPKRLDNVERVLDLVEDIVFREGDVDKLDIRKAADEDFSNIDPEKNRVDQTSLKLGDEYTIDGEKFKVISESEDGKITVQDGKKMVLNVDDRLTIDKGSHKQKDGLSRAEQNKADDFDFSDIKDEPSARDLEAEQAEKTSSGFIVAPTNQQLEAIRNWFRRKFSVRQGLPTELFDEAKVRRNDLAAAEATSAADSAELKLIRKKLGKKFGRKEVNQNLSDVLHGRMTVDQFQTKYQLSKNSPMVDAMNKIKADIAARGVELADLLKKTGGPDALIKTIRENADYLTRFYEIHLLGENFTPKPGDYNAAIMEVKAGLLDGMERLAGKLTKAQEKSGVDVLEYMETGEQGKLDGLTDDQRAAITGLGEAYFNMKPIINTAVMDDDKVSLSPKTDALNDAAHGLVDNILNKQTRKPGERGSIDVGNLSKRHLGEAFRALFGEVTDPVLATRQTSAVQGKLLANLTFFETVFREGEGSWWSTLPSPAKGLTVKMPDGQSAQLKYGNIAGRYVNPNFKAFLDGPGKSKLGAYFVVKSTQRLIKLYGVRTITRNYVQSILGFALGSGDLLEKGYLKNFRKADKLAGAALRGEPEALRVAAELAKHDVFRDQGSSLADDVNRMTSSLGKGRLKQALQKAGSIYAYIDFPAKVASYWTMKDKGMSDKDAAEHVRKFYQHPDSLAPVIRDMGKWPVADYPSYWFDSTRILGNQMANIARAGREGNWKPAAGFLLSQAIAIGTYSFLGEKMAKWSRKAFEKMTDQDDETGEIVPATKKEELILRKSLPSYYQSAPLSVWWKTDKDGKRELFYTVTGNQGAFPAEDLIAGAMQASGGSPSKFAAEAGKQVVRDRFNPGMFEESLFRFATGDEMPGFFQDDRYQTKGIFDLGEVDPDKTRIWRESLEGLGLDILGGQLGGKVKQLQGIEQREKREELRAGRFTPRSTKEEVALSLIEPVRTYRITEKQYLESMTKKLRPYVNGINDAKRAINRRPEDQGELNDQRTQYLIEIRAIVQDAQSLAPEWASNGNVKLLLSGEGGLGLTKREANYVIAGVPEKIPIYNSREDTLLLEKKLRFLSEQDKKSKEK